MRFVSSATVLMVLYSFFAVFALPSFCVRTNTLSVLDLGFQEGYVSAIAFLYLEKLLGCMLNNKMQVTCDR